MNISDNLFKFFKIIFKVYCIFSKFVFVKELLFFFKCLYIKVENFFIILIFFIIFYII